MAGSIRTASVKAAEMKQDAKVTNAQIVRQCISLETWQVEEDILGKQSKSRPMNLPLLETEDTFALQLPCPVAMSTTRTIKICLQDSEWSAAKIRSKSCGMLHGSEVVLPGSQKKKLGGLISSLV